MKGVEPLSLDLESRIITTIRHTYKIPILKKLDCVGTQSGALTSLITLYSQFLVDMFTAFGFSESVQLSWASLGLNQEPTDYESVALTN